MKKSVRIILVLSLAAVLSAILLGCAGETIVPGSNWAQKETLVYDIKDGDTKIGTLTIVAEKLEAGSYTVPEIREEPFKITSAVMRGVRYEQTARDNEGNIIMRSVSLMNGFAPLASYKKIDFNGKNTESRAYVDGKNYHYQTNGGEWKKIKVAAARFIDNEILYMSMRSYGEIDSQYSKTVDVIDPASGGKEEITASTTGKRVDYDVSYTDGTGTLKNKTVSCLEINFSKSSSPSGSPISVWYTSGDFKIDGSYSAGAGNASRFIPVIISENNLVYRLTSVKAE